LRCEVCGRKIHDEPVRAVIEGAKLTVCVECSKHGKIILHEEAFLPLPQKGVLGMVTAGKPGKPVALVQRRRSDIPQVALTKELTDDYANKIRVAREKLLLSHEELGLKINEKASVLRHIETGKMAPDNLLASKLEHMLRIQLLVNVSNEQSTTQVHRAAAEELTLGDLVEMNEKSGEAPSKRKQS
jgi:putative transcription factor